MKKGDRVDTPRFCKVEILKVFRSRENAFKAGFNISADYRSPNGFLVYGKMIGPNRMNFVAVKPDGADGRRG